LIQIKARFPTCCTDATGHICRWPRDTALSVYGHNGGGAVLPIGTIPHSLLLRDGPHDPPCHVARRRPRLCSHGWLMRRGRASYRNHLHLLLLRDGHRNPPADFRMGGQSTLKPTEPQAAARSCRAGDCGAGCQGVRSCRAGQTGFAITGVIHTRSF
jgi:hypothetical protein